MGTLHCVHISSKKKALLGFTFRSPHAPILETDASLETHSAEEYVAEALHTTADVPFNLPTAQVGYQSLESDAIQEDDYEIEALETLAHSHKVLLSSDAMRLFVAQITRVEERTTMLEALVSKARVSFPSEDGWVVLNLARLEQLMDEMKSESIEAVA